MSNRLYWLLFLVSVNHQTLKIKAQKIIQLQNCKQASLSICTFSYVSYVSFTALRKTKQNQPRVQKRAKLVQFLTRPHDPFLTVRPLLQVLWDYEVRPSLNLLRNNLILLLKSIHLILNRKYFPILLQFLSSVTTEVCVIVRNCCVSR